MSRRFKPKAEIIQYEQLRAAAGGSGSSSGGGFRCGQSLICKVSHAEPGGWAVIVQKDAMPGFLFTDLQLRPGDEIFAIFVCVRDGRILLQLRFRNTNSRAIKPEAPSWEERLNQVNQTGQFRTEEIPEILLDDDLE
jgi:hypothetical protein